jgi:hypothetical protein
MIKYNKNKIAERNIFGIDYKCSFSKLFLLHLTRFFIMLKKKKMKLTYIELPQSFRLRESQQYHIQLY